MLTEPLKSVAIRTPLPNAEVAWFDDLCGGDTQYLGVLDEKRRSNYKHCRNIMLTAERMGFGNILLPTSYLVGQEVIPFASAMGPQTESINMLTALRTGEIFPTMLARHIATLDHILKGRLTINIINSNLPGVIESPELRYKRCCETIEILKQAWTKESIDFEGEIYQVKLDTTDPVKPYQQNGGPLLYFGGISEGSKEVCAKYCDWYKRKVPSGMLPAIELDGRIIKESDDILIALEKVFAPLNQGMEDPTVLTLRQLERLLFRAWCAWLCSRTDSSQQEQRNREQFIAVVARVESALGSTPSPYFLSGFGIVDVIFTPYLERMNASLYYYKGYSLREENPRLSAWFAAMESRTTYCATQSDFHTHVHDLPPQMGGCWENGETQMLLNKARVDNGPWFGLPDVTYPEPENSRMEALKRTIKHRINIIRVNPKDYKLFDRALRCALTHMITGEDCVPPSGSDVALRYLRDRINVPRDMSIYAAKRLRESLEKTAALAGDGQPAPIPTKHRRDQDPSNFAIK